MLRIFLILTVVFSSILRAETTLEQAERQYQNELKTAREKYIVKLKLEMTNLTKAGDLDAALKVKAKIAEVEGEAASPTKPNAAVPAGIKEAKKGEWISKDATYTMNSTHPGFPPLPELLNGNQPSRGFSCHSREGDANPFLVIDLKSICAVSSLEIVNRKGEGWLRAKTLTMWVSDNEAGPWQQVWKANDGLEEWTADLPAPAPCRFVKLGLRERVSLHLYTVKLFGFKK